VCWRVRERLGRVCVTAGGGPVLRADSNNCCGIMLTIMSWLLILFTLPFSLGVCLRVRLLSTSPGRFIVRQLTACTDHHVGSLIFVVAGNCIKILFVLCSGYKLQLQDTNRQGIAPKKERKLGKYPRWETFVEQ